MVTINSFLKTINSKAVNNSENSVSKNTIAKDTILKNDSVKENISKVDIAKDSISHDDIREICADAYPQLEKFYYKLLSEGEVRGLIGPFEIPRLWERHILNSAAVIEAINFYRKRNNRKELYIADVGSGAGFPGIVLAVFLPRDHITLIEPMERRVQWLQEVCEELHLENITIFKGRAEEYRHRVDKKEREKRNKKQGKESPLPVMSSLTLPRYFDIVTCRAVARLSLLIEWTFPLLSKKGELIALKGKSISQEVEKTQKTLRTYRAGKPIICETSIDPRVERTYVVRVPKISP